MPLTLLQCLIVGLYVLLGAVVLAAGLHMGWRCKNGQSPIPPLPHKPPAPAPLKFPPKPQEKV